MEGLLASVILIVSLACVAFAATALRLRGRLADAQGAEDAHRANVAALRDALDQEHRARIEERARLEAALARQDTAMRDALQAALKVSDPEERRRRLRALGMGNNGTT